MKFSRPLFFTLISLAVSAVATVPFIELRLGKQPDNSFLVSSGQRVEAGAIAFDGRPVDLALHPTKEIVAVLGQDRVFLADTQSVLEGTNVPLGSGAAFHGLVWSLDGSTLYASTAGGYVLTIRYRDGKLLAGERIMLKKSEDKRDSRPGGMCLTRDGKTLFVADMDRNCVTEIALGTRENKSEIVRDFPVQNLPYTVKLSFDEKTLVVTNWGGRFAKKNAKGEEVEETAPSLTAALVVKPNHANASGTVSFIERATGATTHLEVGRHPTDLLIENKTAFVANSASDTISVLDVERHTLKKTISVHPDRSVLPQNPLQRFGSIPTALARYGNALLVTHGGDNALSEIALDDDADSPLTFRPVGYFPIAVALAHDGKTAFVLNTKGNGSVRNTVNGKPGNAHDFQGSLSIVDLKSDPVKATERVIANNHWRQEVSQLKPDLAVYKGKIKHVLYIIKENRTYDEVFGDLPEGNGDPKLCGLGETVTPNHHALARQFTLFDNGYVSGTNSADGHAWSTQSLANDYLEHFYTGYRTYPDDIDDPMGLSDAGGLWDAALKKKKTLRIYGETCDDARCVYTPMPESWLEMWNDRKAGTNKYVVTPYSHLKHLRPYIHPHYGYWPLYQSDQHRADLFTEEYARFSKADKVPNLMIMTLPCDHTEGLNTQFPKPKSMVADNDLALGRIVEAVSKSPQWKETCIFVIEDDAQAGPDHVDGHRTVYMVISPYVKRKFVSHELGTTVTMLRSIELMLGLDPMNRFDAAALPLTDCFTNTPDFSPYMVRPNLVKLDDMNLPKSALSPAMQKWKMASDSLDWSGLDRPDFAVLNRVVWHSLHGSETPYPGETGKDLRVKQR